MCVFQCWRPNSSLLLSAVPTVLSVLSVTLRVCVLGRYYLLVKGFSGPLSPSRPRGTDRGSLPSHPRSAARS
ncbi:hypothetical protein M419DRAFT_120601 [Trichoderma reesei RUT C-30]|uniref:Uncharacterized protein n=1 Tax=Hypocrea jecorina (strain ATCC 56765 / BCRC 32924 / NRRL 11460 / Rut C-30) TaxID=1344414 RepID=A0A024S1I4_HYPJR|nr:hypothetical protein M419DRAFT_120601 [Trichoderma reesei RUT C-30]